MLVEMAVADAYAIAWEFTNQQTAANDLLSYHQHPNYAELQPGQYTDDTQRAIGNAAVLLSPDPMAIINPLAYATSYLKTYDESPRDGYSRGFQALLKEVRTPEEFLLKVRRTRASNGSVMGVAVLGFIRDISMLKLAATIQATTTHHYTSAIDAQLVALAAHYCIFNHGPRHDMRAWLMEHADWLAGNDDSYRWSWLIDQYAGDPGRKTSIKASSISSYVVYALENHTSLTSIILDAVNRGGDTDSGAASAVTVASCHESIELNIPQVLVDTLEPHTKGSVDHLRALDRSLRLKAGV